jgi:hypothetical protein
LAVIPNRKIGDVVIERVAGEVATPDVIIDGAIDVVANNEATLIDDTLDSSKS